jgi:uncharacterized protein with NRDE domain
MLADYPLLVAANRDEQYDRPSAPPRRLDDVPSIVAGRDLRAGGTWLGINDRGVLAAMLNRRMSTGIKPAPDARSRGLLCMDLLARRSAIVSYNAGAAIVTERLKPGLHVFSSAADFDLRSSKADRAYALFGALTEKLKRDHNNGRDIVAALGSALGDHSLPAGSSDPGDAICVHRGSSGTVSSSIVLLSASGSRFELFHCPGAPCENSFGDPIDLHVQ